MMDTEELSDFSRGMNRLIGRPTDLRPFVCEGSPLECEVFLVGINPASEMSNDFWDFWSDSYGFDKRTWFEKYKLERMNRPLRPGKKRRNAVSNTRRVIEWILEEAKPIKCLETNIYAKAAAQAPDLDRICRITASFERLYFVVETKGSQFPSDLRIAESARIACGRAHFDALKVRERPARYEVAPGLEELLANL